MRALLPLLQTSKQSVKLTLFAFRLFCRKLPKILHSCLQLRSLAMPLLHSADDVSVTEVIIINVSLPGNVLYIALLNKVIVT